MIKYIILTTKKNVLNYMIMVCKLLNLLKKCKLAFIRKLRIFFKSKLNT